MSDMTLSNEYLQRFLELSHDPQTAGVFNTLYLCNTQSNNHRDVLELELLYRTSYPDEKVARIRATDFLEAYLTAICGSLTEEFKNYYRSLDLLILEDVESISGKPTVMETVYIIVDYLLEHQRHIVFTSSLLPRELALLEDRNRAQFEGCPICNLRDRFGM